MTKKLTQTRRAFLGSALATGSALAATRPSRAQSKPEKLVFVGDNGMWHDCLYKVVAPDFEKQTGIHVDFTALPVDGLTARLQAELNGSGTGIDIVQWTGSYAGWLTPHMEDHEKLLAAAASRHPDFDWDDFMPSIREMATWNGKLSGIPYRVTTGIFHYQKALLEQVGFSKPPGLLPNCNRQRSPAPRPVRRPIGTGWVTWGARARRCRMDFAAICGPTAATTTIRRPGRSSSTSRLPWKRCSSMAT